MSDGFVLNRKGGAEVLNSLAAELVNQTAQKIADACGPEANVESYTTDRSGASVSVPAYMQAKDGALTKAASSLGLEVTPKEVTTREVTQMTDTIINPQAVLIPDQAEVWIVLASGVTDITTMIPVTPLDDLGALGWSFCGLIDDKKGIPVTPSIEVKEYNAFGHPFFRIKLLHGKIQTGFTILEDNATTQKIVLPGSASNKIGAPKDVQIYVLYRFSDEDNARAWVTLTPAPVEIKAHGGIVEGEESFAEALVHHTNDANNDVFQIVTGTGEITGTGAEETTKVFTIGTGVTAYTVTANAQTTASIAILTATALQTALQALASIGSDGVTVEGTTGGPLTAEFTVPVSGVSATGTGGTVTVD